MIRKLVRVLLRVVLTVAVVVALLAAAVSAGAWFGWRGEPDPRHGSGGRDAVWLAAEWRLAGDLEGLDPDALLALLDENRVTDAFLPIGVMGRRGTIPDRNQRQLAAAHDAFSGRGVRIHAVLSGIDVSADGLLELDNDETLDGIAATAEQVLASGYAGVVVELRPWRSGDARLLALLDRLRGITSAAGAELTVVAPPPDPGPGVGAVLDLVGDPRTWSKDYHLDVAQRVDVVVVAMYDLSLPFGWMDGALTDRTTTTLVDLHRGTDVQLLVGLAADDHLGAGIRGVQKGIEEADPPQLERVGIALLGEPSMDEPAWRRWRETWIEVESGGDGPS